MPHPLLCRRLLPLLLAGVVPVATASAQPLAPAAPALSQQAEGTGTRVGYAAYAAGLNVLALQAEFAIGPRAYRMRLVLDTAGVFGAVVHSHSESTVQGSFEGEAARPSRFYSWGDTRGRRRITQIDYAGGQPTVVQQVPPPDAEERDPVPVAQTAGTIDSLSATAELVHMVAGTGRCDGTARLYDGQRLSELTAHTVGQEVLPASDRSSFAGPALRCDFEGRQLAGFVHDVDEATLRQVQHGSAWLAPLVPGGPVVPVRISFQTRWFGQATMYVTAPPKS